MHTRFKKHVDILPPFGNLSNIPNITTLLLPSNQNYAGYSLIKSVYDWFSDSIANILFDTDVINDKRTPQAHRIIVTHTHTDDGWELLFILLSKRCPFLGGKSLDVATEITMLKVSSNDTIHTFYNKIQDLQTKLRYSCKTVDKTWVLRLYLKAMAALKDHFPLLQHFISDLNLHINKYGANTTHPIHTCASIYDYLLSIDAPERFNLTSSFHPSGYKHNKKSFHHCSSNTLHQANISAMEQVQDFFNTTTKTTEDSFPDSSSHQNTTNDDIPSQYAPFFAAFCRSSMIICNTCGSKGHHASKCFKRGLDFLPCDVQRRITGYNAKFGTTPTTD